MSVTVKGSLSSVMYFERQISECGSVFVSKQWIQGEGIHARM